MEEKRDNPRWTSTPFRLVSLLCLLGHVVSLSLYPGVYKMDTALSPLTVALGRNAQRLGKGKNRAPVFSLQCSRSRIFVSLVFTNRSLCGGERVPPTYCWGLPCSGLESPPGGSSNYSQIKSNQIKRLYFTTVARDSGEH